VTTSEFAQVSVADELVAAVLRRAAGRATLAPSIHNTQPWRFVLGPDRLDLYADSTRRVPAIDPTGRQLAISCGAALFGARAALAGSGYATVSTLLPDSADADLLASIVVVPSAAPVDGEAARLDNAAELRHSNRRQFGPELIPDAILDTLVRAAAAEGAWLQPVRELDDRVTVATLTQRAEAMQIADPAYRAELAAWTTDDPQRLDGVPVDAIQHVTDAAQDDIPIRDFDTRGEGELPADTHSRLDQTIMVLGTAGDSRNDWLVAGQALERILLELTRAGLQASILSQVTENTITREQLRHELRLVGNVQLLLRAGVAEPTPATPRRRMTDVLS
jgi:nitroreductase